MKAMVLIDMIGDRDLRIKRDTSSTAWLTDVIWTAARQQKPDATFVPDSTQVQDDHLPFLQAGVPSVDILDLERYQQLGKWHAAEDTLAASVREACGWSATSCSPRGRRSKPD